MGTFLKLFSLELNLLEKDDFFEPEAELRPDDQIVGDLSEEFIRLYTMWRLTEKRMDEKMMEAKFGRLSEGQIKDALSRAKELSIKADFFRELFWIELKDEYHLWDKPSIGVRRGRKVVWYEEKGPTILGLDFPHDF